MTEDEIYFYLSNARQAQKLSITALAKKTHMNRTTVAKRELLVYGCTTRSLLKWADALKCEIIVRKKGTE